MPRKKVLLVDDSPATLKIISEFLRGNYQVFIAKSGEEAIELLKSHVEPDLLILDIIMPGISGFDVIKKMKLNEEWRDIPIIVSSANSEKENMDKARGMGAVGFIEKPYVITEAINKVKTYLE